MNFIIQASINWKSKYDYVHTSLPPPAISTGFEYLLGHKVAVLHIHHAVIFQSIMI
jgi:hypothetical protein